MGVLLNNRKKTFIFFPHVILQISDTTLEEFLEELDSLTDAEAEDPKDSKSKASPSPLPSSASEEVSGSTAHVSAAGPREESPAGGKAEASSGSLEKKVRFSEELIQTVHTKQTTVSQDSACSESRCLGSLKASSSQTKQGPEQPVESAQRDDGSPQDQGGVPSAPPVDSEQPTQTECSKTDSEPLAVPCSLSPETPCGSEQENSALPVELTKCNISNTNTGMEGHQCLATYE